MFHPCNRSLLYRSIPLRFVDVRAKRVVFRLFCAANRLLSLGANEVHGQS
jgi:hypothetical protein